MAIAEEMKNITENIVTSYDVRVKALSDLVADTHKALADTHKTLNGFATDRKKMAAEQAKDLAGFADGLSKNVQGFLKDFQKNHQQMSREQAKGLSDFMTRLTKDVHSMLSHFETHRSEMSDALRDQLAKEIKGIQSQVKHILNEADKTIGEFSSEIAQAKRAWKDMTARLARARKGGVMPRIEAGKNASTVEEAVSTGRRRKAAGAKRKVAVGV